LIVVLLAAPAAAQDPPHPLSAYHRFMFGVVKTILIKSAEKMPEEHYGFKPADTVRTYGQIVGHVADAQYAHCSAVLGEKNPAPRIEQTKSTKADLVSALKEALAYCDRAYDTMTDTAGAQMMKSMGTDAPKLGVLAGHLVHSTEHYGNLVTYMRMKDIVPPTSEPGFMPVPKKQRQGTRM
jgi:uncharacterized damage-inducible protein DinB